jgi:hypothetical protein
MSNDANLAIRAAELDDSLPRVVRRFRRRLRWEALSWAVDALHQWVARGVEWYNATCGWIFLLDKNKTVLRSVPGATVRSRARRVVIPRQSKRRSFMWRVVEDQKGDFANDITKLRGYWELDPDTKSELAVPLFDQDGREGGKIIGVYNLESKDREAFFPALVHELQRNAALLTVHLLVLRDWYGRKHGTRPWVWHPEVHGWHPGKLMDRFCHMVVKGASRRGEKEPVCSAWNADPQRCWVLGNSGYDYDFCSRHVLPAESATGRVAAAGERGVLRGSPEEVGFLYLSKAERMGVKRAQIVSLRRLKEAVRGTLNLYALDEKTALPTDGGMRWLARQAEGLLATVNRQRETFGKAYVHGQLVKSASPSPDPEVFRRALMKVLPSHALSIFLPATGEGRHVLKPIDSTGFVDDSLPLSDVSFEYKGGGQREESITAHCFTHPGGPVRINFPSDFKRNPDVPPPAKAYPERIVYRDDDRVRRRRLGIGVIGSNNKSLGVIRLYRSSKGRPFTDADGRLLQAIAHSAKCRSLFVNWAFEREGLKVVPDVPIPLTVALESTLQEVMTDIGEVVKQGKVFVRRGSRYQEFACHPPHEHPPEEALLELPHGPQGTKPRKALLAWDDAHLMQAILAFDFADEASAQAQQAKVDEAAVKIAAVLSNNYWKPNMADLQKGEGRVMAEYVNYVSTLKEIVQAKLKLHDAPLLADWPRLDLCPDSDLGTYGVTLAATGLHCQVPLRAGDRIKATLLCDLDTGLAGQLAKALSDHKQLQALGKGGPAVLNPELRWRMQHEDTWRQLRRCVARIVGAWARIVAPKLT